MILIGLIALLLGAEWLVRGASNLARAFGIPPLVVGLTIVAFGTGTPELLVSTVAAYQGETAIAIGNVIGSGIVNTLCILGAAAAICPLVVNKQLLRLDIPIMIAVTLLLYLVALYGVITPMIGALFVLLMIGYTLFSLYKGQEEQKETPPEKKLFRDLSLMIAGSLLLAWGADYLIHGAKELAHYLGIDELIVGLTVVAFGTSLPELATTVMAAIRGERELAVGNVVGSNIFNILAVMGLSALISPNGLPVPQVVIDFDLPVLLISAVACLPIFFTGHKISRWEGFLFLGYFIAYVIHIVLQATDKVLLEPFTTAMVLFVIPLTLITLGISLYRHFNLRFR